MSAACLHCAISAAIQAHAEEHCPRDEATGLPVMDLVDLSAALGLVFGTFVSGSSKEAQVTAAIVFAKNSTAAHVAATERRAGVH